MQDEPTRLPTRTAVFIDFDGTIADHRGDIAPSTVSAIRTARANGHLVFLSTGRCPAEIAPEVHAIGFDGYITAAGGFAHVGDAPVFSQTIPRQDLARMLDVYADAGVEYCLQYVDSVYCTPGMLDAFAAADRGDSASLVPHRLRPTLDLDGVAKSVFTGHRPGCYKRVRAALTADGFTVITGTLPHLGTENGEASPAGTHKAAPIPALLRATGVPCHATLAIGDSTNDIDMLRYCRTGIAMAEAPDHVKDAADEITTGVTDDGVWNAFMSCGLL